MSGARIIDSLKQATCTGKFSRVTIGGHAWICLPDHTRHAVNSKAWALGRKTGRGFHVRRVVWGRLLARAEKRDGEIIRRVSLLVSGRP